MDVLQKQSYPLRFFPENKTIRWSLTLLTMVLLLFVTRMGISISKLHKYSESSLPWIGGGIVDVGSFFPFYREPKAYAESLMAYKRQYKYGTIVLVCAEGCYNYYYSAKEVQAVLFESPRRMWLPDTTPRQVDRDSALLLLHTFRDAIYLQRERFFVWQDDSILFVKPVTEEPIHSFNSIATQEVLPPRLTSLIQEKQPHLPNKLMVGRHVGAIYMNGFYLTIGKFEELPTIIDDMFRAVESEKLHMSADMLLSAITWYYGGTVGSTSIIGNYDDKSITDLLVANKISILRHYTEFHGVINLSPAEKEILGPLEDIYTPFG